MLEQLHFDKLRLDLCQWANDMVHQINDSCHPNSRGESNSAVSLPCGFCDAGTHLL